MKIGIDARLWNETGVGRYIRNLVWELQELDKKNEYVLFVTQGIRNQEPALPAGRLGIRENRNWKIIETDIHWHTIEEQLKFPKVLEQENLDIVHFPYFSVPIFYKKPFVITIHDLIINHYPTGKASTLPLPLYSLKHMGYQIVLKQAAKKASKIIAVSQATKDEIVKHLGVFKEKVAVTYEGVNTSLRAKRSNPNKIATAISWLRNDKYFLYVGNAYPHKNLERLIDSFVLVIKEYPDIKLILVGKEDYFYRRLKDKVKKLKIEKNILFADYVPDDELSLYYKNAIGTIVPSLMEGFGLPGLEAMQFDCLVLASDIPVLREIYQDAAVYFNPLEITSMHATIREVLENKKQFDSTIEKGKKQVVKFSWKKMAEETLKIYESSISVRSNQ